MLHAGSIGWKNARSRVLDTYTLVLTDLLVFLQKNEQKYTFFLQDNKVTQIDLVFLDAISANGRMGFVVKIFFF